MKNTYKEGRMKSGKVEGILAEFENPGTLLHAAEKLRDSGYKKFDCHSPFPIHGMDRAMGEKRSFLGWIVGVVAFGALAFGFLFEGWTSTFGYPLVISGKPLFSYQAFGAVAFAIMVLSSALATLLSMLIVNKLPRYHHPVFYSDRFAKATDDSFFVSVESNDPQFDSDKTAGFLESIGGKEVELLTAND